MKVHETGLSGLWLVEPRRFGDGRGFFYENYNQARYRDAGMNFVFVQDNHSRSSRGVLRGMHFQVMRPQAQMVTVMRGKVFDVAVDLRPASVTFGKWFGSELSDEGVCQMVMAPGFAHGFLVLSEFADLHYKVSRLYDHGDEGGVRWNDPDIGISWPGTPPSLSARDAAYPLLKGLAPAQLPHDPPIEAGKP
jgi:dTDP-4-dehydrorhamnose 3,5-epimerase